MVNIINTTESHTLKWRILGYINFTSIKNLWRNALFTVYGVVTEWM